MNTIISIDCGTTSTRCIVFNDHHGIEHIESSELQLSHPFPQWVEQSTNEIWLQTYSCLSKTFDCISPSSVAAIAITNQRETAIIWDRVTGEPIGPAISWQCRRSADQCDQYSDHAPMIRQKTGLPLDPYFTATKYQWLLRHCDSATELLNKNQLCFGTVDTWILWKLTNGNAYATDVTNASRTMLYNIHTLSYDNELCTLFNIPIDALPRVYPSSHLFGHTTIHGTTIPIQSMIGDQQAALFAQCGRSTNMIKNTYGTGLFLMANTGSNIIHSNDLVSTIAIGIDGCVDYAIEGSVFTGELSNSMVTR